MKLPFWIYLLCFMQLNVAAQNTFLKVYSEGNFNVDPWMIENGLNGPIICGFKSRQNPDRAYFFCDGFNQEASKIETDSILFNNEVLFFKNQDNRPTVIDNKVYWFKESYDSFNVIAVDLLDSSIEVIDTLDFTDSNFRPEHMKFISSNMYFFTGTVSRETQNGIISDFAIAKVYNQQINVFVDYIVGSDHSFGRRILSIRNDSIKTLSDFSRGDTDKGFQISTFDYNLKKIDSIQTEFSQPRLGIKFDGIEDSEGNYVFVGWDYDSFENYLTFMSNDGSIIWHKKIGHNLNAGSSSKITSLIESNENDGYIFAGSDLTRNTEVDSIFSYAVVGKISRIGEIEWYRKYKLIDSTKARHEFFDICPSENNGYYLAGKVISYDELEPEKIKLLLAKVDSEGLIDGYTNIESIEFDNSERFTVFPSPFKEHITLIKKQQKEVIFKIHNNQGQLIEVFVLDLGNLEKLIDTAGYSPGVYYIGSYVDGEKTHVEKVIKLE